MSSDALFGDVADLIEGARRLTAVAVNGELVMQYWSIGKRVREEVLGGERAGYGQRVIKRLAEKLTERYGRGWSKQNLPRMLQFATAYPDYSIVSPLAGQLTWTNISELPTIAHQPKRDFYTAFCIHERWSKRTPAPASRASSMSARWLRADRRGPDGRPRSIVYPIAR